MISSSRGSRVIDIRDPKALRILEDCDKDGRYKLKSEVDDSQFQEQVLLDEEIINGLSYVNFNSGLGDFVTLSYNEYVQSGRPKKLIRRTIVSYETEGSLIFTS